MKHSASSIDQISELLDLPVDNAKYITQMLHIQVEKPSRKRLLAVTKIYGKIKHTVMYE